jgi:predicted deacylase
VAIQRNSFGDVVAEYRSNVSGEVAGQRSDAMAQPGDFLTFILFEKPAPEGDETYQE